MDKQSWKDLIEVAGVLAIVASLRIPVKLNTDSG